jgi:hypothetical protein
VVDPLPARKDFQLGTWLPSAALRVNDSTQEMGNIQL